MKKFIIKLFIFLFPFLVFLSIAFIADPLKVFFYHENFYANNFVTLNREMVCLKLFQRNNEKYKYDSFILGNSRSLAYKIENWMNYFPKGSEGFHFDASGEGLYGIYNKLRYIDETGNKINNVLIIIDDQAMNVVKNREGYLFITPPELSKENPVDYYLEFMKANVNTKFLMGYFDYRIFKTYKPYMGSLFNKSKYDTISNNITGDLFFGYDKMIQEDEKAYYDDLLKSGVFYDRTKQVIGQQEIKPEEIQLLIKIQAILTKHNTDYHIVISPLYDQIPFSSERLINLKAIFGTDRIYDFSGKNELTESIYNYYENSHYRPHIADIIMKKIYQ